MAQRLTTFSKFLITLVIVGGVAFGGRYFLKNTDLGKNITDKSKSLAEDGKKDGSEKSDNSATIRGDKETIKIGVVTWGGYAGGQYFNEGFKANKNSRFVSEYGFPVEFKILDDFDASRAAWKKGEIDLLWATIDALPTEIAGLADYEPQVAFQSDWSRGGDAIVARRGISKVADLKGKKVAVAEMTPSHSFLLWLLEAGGLKPTDIEIVKQSNAVDAAQVFKSQQVDAAVVWSPDDEACLQSVPGSKILESTRSASNIIADVFIAKKSWIEKNRQKVNQLYEGWMRGAAEINASDAAKRKAAKILSENFEGFTEEMCYKSINNVRLCTNGDNKNFFGLNPDYKGVTGEQLYNRMTATYKSLGYAEGKIPNWRMIADSDALQAFKPVGAEHNAEGQKTFAPATETTKTKDAIATKRVSISFRSGESKLDDNTKYIIDKEMVEIAKAFSNSRIRVQGNTDNVGNTSTNKILSLKRAQSVADYLVNTYGMSRNRFVVVGNGADKPLADNSSEDGRSKNRRTDFELIGE